MKDIDLLHQIDFFDDTGDGSGGGSIEIDNPPTPNDDSTKGFFKDTVVKDRNEIEYICLDDTANNAKWAYLVNSEEDLAHIGIGYKAYVQDNQTIWEFNSINGEWFLLDSNLHKRGIMQINEVWERPYNKIPQGYVQFVYGLVVPNGTTLQVDGELIDLKEKL